MEAFCGQLLVSCGKLHVQKCQYPIHGHTSFQNTLVRKPNGERNRVAEIMTVNFAESGHPIFQATSPLGRGELKSKSGGKKTIHYNGSEDNFAQLFLSISPVSTEH